MFDLIPFDSPDYNIRIVMIDGEPWFIAKDVAEVLGFSRATDAIKYLDEDERGVISNHTPGGDQQMSIINESGLYSLILRSRKPEAKAFKKWITSEVLPTIRQTGGYNRQVALPSRKELAQMVIEAEERLEIEQAARQQAEDWAKQLEPVAESWLNLADAEGDYAIGDVAAILNRDPNIDTGERRLFQFMARRGWIRQVGSGRERHWRPYQTQITAGRLRERPGRTYWDDSIQRNVLGNPQVRVTIKGVHHLHKLMRGTEPPNTLTVVND